MLIYARLPGSRSWWQLPSPVRRRKKVVEPPDPNAKLGKTRLWVFAEVIPSTSAAGASHCWLPCCLPKQTILSPRIFGNLMVGQDGGNGRGKMQGLLGGDQADTAGIVGHSPAPCGPQEPALSQVPHPQKRWERRHPRSTVLHSRAAEQLV